MVDIPMTWKRRPCAGRTDPSGVIAPLIQLATAVSAQVLLKFAALHAVIR
jgi:hypothetical protein